MTAQRLRLSHPMVINLARSLSAAGLVEDFCDPYDSRRRLLRLTDKGWEQAKFLFELNRALTLAFEMMFEEAGDNLFVALCGFERALNRQSVLARVSAPLNNPKDQENS